jgi:hypothetical protein
MSNTIDWGKIHYNSWSPETNLTGTASASALLLDTYSGASVAYSLRKLSSSYSGSAIRVRRSSDNTEQDIGFTGNELDTTSLTSFVGANDGYVTRWYDQSGNANNSAQAAATVQPQIVSSGTVLTNNSKPSMFLENQDSLTFTSLTPITTFTVAKIDTLNYAIHYVLFNNVSPRGYFYGGTFSGVNGLGIFDGSAKSITGEDTNTHLGYFNYNGTNYEVAKDGSAISNLASGSNFNLNYIGRQQTALSLNGQLQEIVIYPSTQSSNKSNIESNINTYYSIY